MLSNLNDDSCFQRTTGFLVALVLQLVFFFGTASHADDFADTKRASGQLGLALPNEILGNSSVAKQEFR